MRIHKKYDMGELARKIQEARRNNPGEPASFKSFEIRNVLSVLETCIDFNPAIPESDREGVVWKAVVAASEPTDINAAHLESCLRDAERNYLRRRLEDYVIASSLTIGYFDALRSSRINDATMTFSRTLPVRFARGAIQEKLKQATAIEHPHWLAVVRTRVKARTDAAAINDALDNLDLLRGMWNFAVNIRTTMRRSFGDRRPVNQILLGPIHTLHSPNGALLSESFWFELKHQQFEKLYKMEAEWSRIHKLEKDIRKRILKIEYASSLKSLFVRYTRALDVAEHDVAFNKLWGVFEHLAGAIGNYDDLIKRTLFLYKEADRNYIRLILEHLRDVRNGLVHLDRNRRSMETYLYQLHWFVETFFRFHLTHGREFSSFSTAGQFLDLPHDRDVLQQRIRELTKAARFKLRYK